MAKRGLGREQIYDVTRGGYYPHPLVSCLLPLCALLAVTALMLGGFTIWQQSLPRDVSVPPVRGLASDQANSALRKAGLRYSEAEKRSYDEEIPEGLVLKTDPPAGRRVKKWRQVTVFISAGSSYTLVPDVRELPLEAARDRMRESRLLVGSVQYAPHAVIPFDRVIGATPAAGTKLPVNSQISLKVSQGIPQPGEMPEATLRTCNVVVEVPTDSDQPDVVRIDVTDRNGKRTVFQESRRPGETVTESVQGVGDITVEAYFGTRLILKQEY